MLKLKYEDRLDFSEWSRLLYRQLFFCLIIIFVIEATFFIHTNSEASYGSSALPSLVVPLGIQAALYATAVFSTNYFIKKGSPFMQSIVMCSFISMSCYLLTFRLYRIHSIYIVSSFPLLASLVYVDRKPLLYTLMINMLMHLSYTAYILPARPGYIAGASKPVELVSTSMFLIMACLACNVILLVLSRVVNNLIVKDEELKLDSFTGLLNHTAFYERLEMLIAENIKDGSEFSLIIWDIDNFKDVNDNYGHEVGDKVLLRFSEILNKVISQSDYAFRYGGDEFALLIRKNAKETYTMALKIREIFYETVRRLNLDVPVTVSAGLCEFDKTLFFGSNEFFNATDSALYAAKGTENKDLIVSVHTPIWEDETPLEQYEAPSPSL